jgi:hypothetical protein
MNAKITKHKNKVIKGKQKNKGINRRKDTLVKKAHKLRQFNSVDVALIICKHS